MKLLSPRTSLILIVVLLVLGAGAFYESTQVSDRTILKNTTPAALSTTTSTATIAPSTMPTPTPMRYEVVTTAAAQEQGLGGRASIPDNYAMFFVFPTDGRYGFWMKDMLVPIDMIWLSDNGTIVLIDDSVSPDTYPNVFYPPAPVKYVLETKAGFATEHGWTVGTQVTLPAPYGAS